MRYLTISKWPSKQAARSGVELVLVVQFTEAPRRIRKRTIGTWPAAAATHNGGAPSIVSPSNVTKNRPINLHHSHSQIALVIPEPACSISAPHRSTRYSTTSRWPFRQAMSIGVAPLVLAETRSATSFRARFSRKPCK